MHFYDEGMGNSLALSTWQLVLMDLAIISATIVGQRTLLKSGHRRYRVIKNPLRCKRSCIEVLALQKRHALTLSYHQPSVNAGLVTTIHTAPKIHPRRQEILQASRTPAHLWSAKTPINFPLHTQLSPLKSESVAAYNNLGQKRTAGLWPCSAAEEHLFLSRFGLSTCRGESATDQLLIGEGFVRTAGPPLQMAQID